MVLLVIVLSLFPIIDFANPWSYAAKVGTVVVAAFSRPRALGDFDASGGSI
jgi:hypothetical protein